MEQYYYSKLDKTGAAVYNAMLKGLTALEDEFLIPSCEMQEIADIFFRLRLDHPEIFWASDFRVQYYKDSPNKIFLPTYIFTKDKIRDHQKALEARRKKLAAPMQKMSELEKEQYVHDFICENVQYDKLKKPYSHEIIGPLGHGVGVCEGIAKSVKLLLDEAKVWNIIAVCGNNPEKGIKYRHVWNVVRIGGTYYHLDATFDNTLTKYVKGAAEDSGKKLSDAELKEAIRYDYFNLSDKQIFRDHEPLIAPAPACTDADHFYYKEKKISFTKIEDVYKRALQYAKKNRTLTFHWRGGYFTREIFLELVEEIRKAAAEKNKACRISVNFPQAVMRVSFENAEDARILSEEEKKEEIVMEESNISEQYEEA